MLGKTFLVLVGVMAWSMVGSLAFAQDETTAPLLTLDQPVHFIGPDGGDLKIPPGTYRVELAEEWLRLTPRTENRRQSHLIEASGISHEEETVHPVVLATPGEQEDDFHLLLLLPDGRGREAIGTYSGVRPRGISRRRLSRTKVSRAFRNTKTIGARMQTIRKAKEKFKGGNLPPPVNTPYQPRHR